VTRYPFAFRATAIPAVGLGVHLSAERGASAVASCGAARCAVMLMEMVGAVRGAGGPDSGRAREVNTRPLVLDLVSGVVRSVDGVQLYAPTPRLSSGGYSLVLESTDIRPLTAPFYLSLLLRPKDLST
jgi:hypothetical protein